MPNAYTTPAEGNNAFVQTDALNSSQEIRTEALTAMAKLSNYCFAHQSTGPCINQYFGPGIFYYASSTPRTACQWRVASISSMHTLFTAKVRYRGNGTNLPQISWRVTTENGTLFTFSHSDEVISTAYQYSTMSFNIPTNQTGKYRTFELVVSGPIQISNVVVDTAALSSPLSQINFTQNSINGASMSFLPTRDTLFAADSPLSTPKLLQVRDNINTLQLRRRNLFSYSGLDLGYEQATNPWLGAKTVRPQRGLLLKDFQNIVHGGIMALPYFSNPERLPFRFEVYFYTIAVGFDYKFSLFDQEYTILAGTSGWQTKQISYTPPLYEVEKYTMQTPLFRFKALTQFTDPLGDNYEASPITSLTLIGV